MTILVRLLILAGKKLLESFMVNTKVHVFSFQPSEMCENVKRVLCQRFLHCVEGLAALRMLLRLAG